MEKVELQNNHCGSCGCSCTCNATCGRDVWIKNRMEEMRTKYNLSADSWKNAPMPSVLLSIKNSTPNISNGLWVSDVNGKLCETDSNARAGLRRKVNDL